MFSELIKQEYISSKQTQQINGNTYITKKQLKNCLSIFHTDHFKGRAKIEDLINRIQKLYSKADPKNLGRISLKDQDFFTLDIEMINQMKSGVNAAKAPASSRSQG